MGEASKPEGADQLGPVLEFMKLLWAVDHGLQSISKHMESRFGITGPQRLVVRIVGRFPGISAGALADVVLLYGAARTGGRRGVGTRGMLVRLRCVGDARSAIFVFTQLR